MKAFICVDDGNGRLFCGRRQSRDRILTEDMLKTVGDGTLFIEKYSETLFETKRKEDLGLLRTARFGGRIFLLREDRSVGV